MDGLAFGIRSPKENNSAPADKTPTRADYLAAAYQCNASLKLANNL